MASDSATVYRGKNVCYVLPSGNCHAGIITKIVHRGKDDATLVNIFVFKGDSDDGLPPVGMLRLNVLYSEKKEPDTWHELEEN